MTSTAAPVTVVKVDGGGGAQCGSCKGELHFCWRVTYSNGTRGTFCSACCPVVGDVK